MSETSAPVGPLSGVTVLDLSSVGPAARCTPPAGRLRRPGGQGGARSPRPTPRRSSRPSSPTAGCAAWSGCWSTSKTTTAGRPSWPWPRRPTWWSRASGPAWWTGSASATTRSRPATRASSTARPAATARTARRAQRAGHDINYLAVGGFLAMSTPGADGAPPLPGATVADAAAGGMHAALAISAALAGRAISGVGTYLDVSVADGVLWLMSLPIDEHLALGDGARARARHPLGPLRLLRHLPGARRQVAGRRGHRGQVLRQPLRRARPVDDLVAAAARRRRPADHPGRPGLGLRHPRPRRVGGLAGRRRHLRGPGALGGRDGRRRPVRRPSRRRRGDPPDRRAPRDSWRPCWPAWTDPTEPIALPDPTRHATPSSCCGPPGSRRPSSTAG